MVQFISFHQQKLSKSSPYDDGKSRRQEQKFIWGSWQWNGNREVKIFHYPNKKTSIHNSRKNKLIGIKISEIENNKTCIGVWNNYVLSQIRFNNISRSGVFLCLTVYCGDILFCWRSVFIQTTTECYIPLESVWRGDFKKSVGPFVCLSVRL